MRVKDLFWILTFFLLAIPAILSWHIFYNFSFYYFIAIEGLILLTGLYLIVFYQRIVKPLRIIGDGMELLKEQDFGSRLRHVGQRYADRIVDVFNKMMEQLKNEQLHLREQNHFLDLLIHSSRMGVIILDLDDRILSLNPATCMMLRVASPEMAITKKLPEIDSLLTSEMEKVPLYDSRTLRLSDANIYKCTHSSFVDKGFHHPFYLLEALTEEVFKAEKKAYEKVIRMIAHEVNNTTAGITSALDTLESTFQLTAGMEDICEVLRISIECCYSMSHFITNFADVVRISKPQFSFWNINEVVVAGKRFMETICRNRHIDIVLGLDQGFSQVNIDVVLFEQVLLNIIKNAAESIDQDGAIYIRTTQHPVCLEIADTGKGISKETEPRLFTPFFSTKPKGQGIGLIFIREVLLTHTCTFSLRSYPDGMTRFKIFFPVGWLVFLLSH
ncbi:MAG: PAS domain-containing protein [Tannerellaceae bacterium]|nr:PAS domain-containing protein [Tannerellaceae bacterium]